MISNITGKRVCCRATEEKILTAWSENKSAKISKRDCVNAGDAEKLYTLWNTDLVSENLETGEVKINITGNDDMTDLYYRHGRIKDVIMTQTTKRRLNAFLDYYGFDSLEVHNSKKEVCVKYHGKELKVDSYSWYKLDFTTKELLKCQTDLREFISTKQF